MELEPTNKTWDIIVIGGGPAGMIAAGKAAERGKSVLLLEKNSSLGKKLLITGGGRCNLTNNKTEVSELISSYKNAPKALFSVFSQFGVTETLDFFHSKGMQTKLEGEGRIFPESNTAESVWEVLVDYLRVGNVKVVSECTVDSITVDEFKLFKIQTSKGEMIGTSCIVATGGISHPETGSTGDGFKWLQSLGHTIVANNFALVPVAIKDAWVKKLAGVTLQNVKIRVVQDGQKQDARTGRILFTHLGVSGPTILNLSSKIGDLLQYGNVTLELDLKPDIDHGQLKLELHNALMGGINRKIKNVLSGLVPSSITSIVLAIAEVDPDKANNSITKEERLRLIKVMKALPMQVKELLGADKAIVSAGGVDIDEVNFKTMESRIVPNLYLAGDVLDIDRPSGGYSLQLCWTTGFVAGSSIQ